MEIEGQIQDIIYRNEVNSYTIATFLMEKEEITVVGYLPFINSGDTLKLIGTIITHPEYGEQFKIQTFEKVIPETPEALEKYLANGNFKGIGPATARKIVETFGAETINVFKFQPQRLAEIKGISKEKALEIAHDFIENWELWQIVGFLDKFGIGPQSAETIYKKLGIDTIGEIQANPYVLLDVATKVDFKKVDQMALELGFDIDSEKRIRSGIKHSLERVSYNGHSTALYSNLVGFVKELLGVSENAIEETIINMKAKEEIILEEREDGSEWIYLLPFYIAEQRIAERILKLQTSQNTKEIKNFEKELKKIEKQIGMTLSDKQKEAVKTINENNVCIITGGPGTGKTTIIKALIELYHVHEMKPVLCAPTGRAAKRMTETTGEEAKTLHRLLEIGKTATNENDGFHTELEIAPIDADIIIVDEVSMVDMFLMNYLCKAIFRGTKLVLVGDIDQLPPVGPGSILKDMINSKTVPTIVLNQIFRQAAKSKIIVNAHKVNEGENLILVKGEEELLEDFFYINENNPDKILENVISLCKGRLQNYGDYEFFKNIQILTPTKKGMLGTAELNKVLQENLNPFETTKQEKKFGSVVFRQGDRVMQVRNNYDILWEKSREFDYHKEVGSGIFNGELGKIEEIDEANKLVIVRFDDDKLAMYAYSDLDQLEHAYAITIHKAQGSEFDVVILPIAQASPVLLTRNLLYTGITRAKKLFIMIGNSGIIEYMIKNADTRKRNTGLEYKLKKM